MDHDRPSKSELEHVWSCKTDEELRLAAFHLGDYTEPARRVIHAEIERRGNDPGLLEPTGPAGTIIDVDEIATAGLGLRPGWLFGLAGLQLVWGCLEATQSERFYDGVIDIVVGAIYLTAGALQSRRIKFFAWTNLVILCVLTAIYGLMSGADLIMSREIRHAMPIVLFVLGVVCIIDTIRRLKNWEALKEKKSTPGTFHVPLSGRAATWYAVSFACGTAAIILVGTFLSENIRPARTSLLETIAFLAVISISSAAANWSYYRARQYRALGAAGTLQRDRRRPILLLRSFGDDMIGLKGRRGVRLPFGLDEMFARTFEEVITRELSRYGPVVAIGRPGESLPVVGAAREYVQSEDWQRKVSSLVDEALLIVALIGITKGLAWELNEISNRGALHKLLLVMPPTSEREDDLHLRWAAFRDLAVRSGQRDVPEPANLTRTLLIDVKKALLFESHSRDVNGYRAAFDEAMRRRFSNADVRTSAPQPCFNNTSAPGHTEHPNLG
jgi:hypothetical protein